jgi:hypothetical protein
MRGFVCFVYSSRQQLKLKAWERGWYFSHFTFTASGDQISWRKKRKRRNWQNLKCWSKSASSARTADRTLGKWVGRLTICCLIRFFGIRFHFVLYTLLLNYNMKRFTDTLERGAALTPLNQRTYHVDDFVLALVVSKSSKWYKSYELRQGGTSGQCSKRKKWLVGIFLYLNFAFLRVWCFSVLMILLKLVNSLSWPHIQ